MIANSKVLSLRPEFALPIFFPPELPISDSIDEISCAIADHQVIIIVGETGSGKTTQIPKICLAQGRGRQGVIVHTQPRRLAAKGIAKRLQQELGDPDAVGTRIRFDDKTSPANYIQVMTDGLLLNLLTQDPMLRWCDTLIVDEAHERSLNIDFLLGLIRRLLKQRPEFRVIITSATIKHHLFSEFFQRAPVFTVSGRTYPVDIQYSASDTWGDFNSDQSVAGIIHVVKDIYEHSNLQGGVAQNACDTLVFLPGERQIHDAAHGLRRYFGERFDILPLYARLANQDQAKVFEPGAKVRIVLATNLAETSITVPRIGYVIDSGIVRVSRYSPRRKVQLLPLEPISKSSAAQRAGRCGRIAPGVCYRLYSQEDFESRPDYPEAEIHRTHLAGVILQMKAMNLGEPGVFPFIEAPALKMINDGYQLLEELGAVRNRILTSLGRKMARLPLDPRIARLVMTANDCLYEILIIASSLSVMDVVDVPREAKQIGQQRHGEFRSKRSDFITTLLVWHRLEWHRLHLTRQEFRSWCEKHFISLTRYYEWRDVHKQLRLLVHDKPNSVDAKLTAKTAFSQYLVEQLSNKNATEPCIDWHTFLSPECEAQIHQPIVAAFATHIAVFDLEAGGFVGCRQRLSFIHPTSDVKPPKIPASLKPASLKKEQGKKSNKKEGKKQWILAADYLETQKLWAKKVAYIDLQWVIPEVGHLLRYTYAEAAWSKKQGAVVAKRSSDLFGLTLKKAEIVNYSSIEPLVCRDLFIRTALVEQHLGDSRQDASLTDFMSYNQALIAEAQELEAKARILGLMADDQEIYDFFNTVIPLDIVDRRSFFSWWKKQKKHNPGQLHFSKSWFLKSKHDYDEFPSSLRIGNTEFALEYHFDLGDKRDGVSIIVPEAQLYQLRQFELEWLVPGLVGEKCEALIRGLPKFERKKFVPIPQFVSSFLAAKYDRNEPLTVCLEDFLKKIKGVTLEQCPWPELEGHLRMNIRLVDRDGTVLGDHNNLDQLKVGLTKAPVIAQALVKTSNQNQSHKQVPQKIIVSRLVDLPNMLEPQTLQSPMTFTTLSHDGEGFVTDEQPLVMVCVPDLVQAEHMLHQGLCLLLDKQTNSIVKSLRKPFFQAPVIRRMVSYFEAKSRSSTADFNGYFWRLLMHSVYETVFLKDDLPVNKQQAQAVFEARSELMSVSESALQDVRIVAEKFEAIASKIQFIRQQAAPLQLYTDQDLVIQFDRLFHESWFTQSSPYNLTTWLVLVKGLEHRLEKRAQRGVRDEIESKQMVNYQVRLDHFQHLLIAKPLKLTRQYYHLLWALQALRAALFAQQLKVVPKVSLKTFQASLQAFEMDFRKA